MKGLHLSRATCFTNKENLHKFIRGCRKHFLSPYLSCISVDLGSPRCQFKTLDSLRDFITQASKEFKFVSTLNFFVRSIHQGASAPLKKLMNEGSIERFARLEAIHVRDLSVEKLYGRCDEKQRAFVRMKTQRWMTVRGFNEPLNTELLKMAACMLRLKTLNRYLNNTMIQRRRDSGVGVDAMEAVVSEGNAVARSW